MFKWFRVLNRKVRARIAADYLASMVPDPGAVRITIATSKDYGHTFEPGDRLCKKCGMSRAMVFASKSWCKIVDDDLPLNRVRSHQPPTE
jgi:hypothetical protein